MANEIEEQEEQEEAWRSSAQAGTEKVSCCGEESQDRESSESSCCSAGTSCSDPQPGGAAGGESEGRGVPAQGAGENKESESSGIIRITAHAVSMIKSVIKEESLPDSAKLRIKVIGGGCAGFSYDMGFEPAGEQTPMDVEADIDGVNVVVDQMSLMYLMGTEIDYVDTLMGTGFKFNNPNVSETCGCGNSFKA